MTQQSSDKRALLAQLLQQKKQTYSSPLSYGQQALWFIYQNAPESPAYNMALPLELQGKLKLTVLQKALQTLVNRHSALRTTIELVNGEPVQTVQPTGAYHWNEHQAVEWSKQQLWSELKTAYEQPFDLTQGPVLRADLFQMAPQRCTLLLTMHHILGDASSMNILGNELLTLYQAELNGQKAVLPSMPTSYADFVRAEAAMLNSPTGEELAQYWQRQLGDESPILNLSTDYHRPTIQTYNGASVPFALPTKLSQQLKQLAQQEKSTLFSLLLTAFQVLLYRYTGQTEIWIGTPTSTSRRQPQFANLIGYLVNPVVLRATIDPSTKLSFSERLSQTQKTVLEAIEHSAYPFPLLVKVLQPERDLSYAPLFQVMLDFQPANSLPLKQSIAGLTISVLELSQMEGQFDLTLNISEGEQLSGRLNYNRDLFNAETIERLAGHFEVLLRAIVDNPAQTISHLPILTEKEVQQLQAWNDTTTDYPADQTIIDLFEQQVEKTPANIAVVFEEQQLSYSELNRKANQLAHYLRGLKNGTDNSLIAIAVERSFSMVIGLLAILKTGGAYVPIDPSYPAVRIRYMLEDSRAKLLLTQSHLKAHRSLDELESDCVVVCLDEVDLANRPSENPSVSRRAEDLAYVIYTSGSTGKPKGVMVEYKGLVNLALTQINIFRILSSSRVLQFASFSFDASVSEITTTLLTGATLYLVPKTRLLDSAYLTTLMVQQQISHITLPPSFLSNLSDQALSGLKTLVVAGEACPAEWVKQWANKVRFINAYGPTESTVCASVALCFSERDTVGIGQPIANTRIYILDTQHQPLPPGIPGELCIAGAGLARGYLNRPELTAEKFLQIELFGKTERIYKTGDLARWLPGGNLEYLGRLDHQIKLRGFRIELGEIETLINQHTKVKEAVVTLYQADDNQRLIAYLTTHSSSESNESESNELVASLKDSLKASLPDYMVPSHFTVLDKLPLTPNGKIDRKALPAPEIELKTGTQPQTPTEDLLAGLMAFVLKRSVINRDDNFFELGGHSLLATQLIARIRDSFKIELPVRAIFEHPSVTTLAAAIETATGTVRLPAIAVQSEDSPKILSFAQQRLWFLNQFEENNRATYNMPVALQLSGQLDRAALQQSLHWMQERHASLRTYFPTNKGQASVQIQAIDKIEDLPIHDLSLMTVESLGSEIQTQINRHAIAPFDLAKGPLFKAKLLQLSETKSVLLLNMHHIISDGWSMGLFTRDWQQAYTAFAIGEKPNLPPLAIQYSDYAAWQRKWLQGEVLQQQIDYWHQQLTARPELLELPTDKPRPPQQSYQGAHYTQHLSPALSQKITTLSRQAGVTDFMTLLASFNILLSRYSRQNDICVGSPIANRTHSQTEDLIGFFVNTLVLRSQLKPQQSFTDLLLETRQTCLEAYAHQDIPFEMLVEQLQPTRRLSHSPLFQVMFVLQNNETAELELPGLDLTVLNAEYPIAKFDLTLSMEIQQGQFHCIWEYATDLFEAETIERLAGHFEVLLRAIVDNPAQTISHLPILTENEVQQLQTWNDTTTDYPADQTIIDLFEQQVETTPANIAVVFEEQQLSYRELNRKANQLAHYLRGLKNGTDNGLIAIAVERSFAMVIGLLAILKTGGAYVPIDPSYPAARIRYMLDDSATPLLLTQSHLKAPLSLDELESDCVVVCLDEVDLANQPFVNPSVSRTATDLAYVIYTSGSTGKPKGVMIEHYGAVNLARFQQQYFHINTDSHILQFASLSFDAATWEFLMSLCNGGALQLVPMNQIQTDLKAILQKQAITHATLPPSVVNVLSNSNLSHLKYLIVAGEACSPELVMKWAQAGRHFINAYGPTEDTVCASVFKCIPDGDKPPIGQPIANTRIYILSAQHQPLPPGIPGELCIAGAGLARGYLNRPELSKEKFIQVELFGKTERIYKTGDLARWLPDGNLEYLGRIDHQIKLRGFRIELGEIETLINQHTKVKEAVVTLYQADDNKRLIAYLTTHSSSESDELVASLTETLKASLPDYMVPSHFTVLDKLPLTPNGKIDRKALPAPELNLTNAYEAPRNDIEQQLAQIWGQLLKQNNISIHDNFFSLGGDSILSIQIVAHARQAGLHLTPRDLFEHQTIAELATAVDFGVFVNAEPGLVTGEVPLTPIQHWFLAQDLPEYWHFNQSILLRVPVDLDVDALRQALAAVLSHHDALRLRYSKVNGDWQQSFAPPSDTLPLFIEDLSQCENPVAQLHQLTQSYQTRFNLTDGPITSLVLFKLTDSARLFWCIHHLVVDGISWRILQEDLHNAYLAALAGQPIPLPAKTSSFKAWAERLVNYAQSEVLASELADWQTLPSFSLPIDNQDGHNDLEHYQDYTITLTRPETEALLKQVPAAYNTRINDVLLTALALALADWTGGRRCLIDLEGHGRAALFDDLDLSRTVGWFTTIHPIALTLPSSLKEDLGAALKAVKEQLRAIPNEGIGYGLLTQVGGKVLPKGEILFNYLGQFDQGIEADLFGFAEETTGSDISLKGPRDHLIDINGAITQGQLRLNWSYSGDCFKAQTIHRLAERYKIHLQQLITHCQGGQKGVTPSDFPLASVAQSALDTLYAQYPGLQDIYPLSPMQQGMLFHALYEPETGVYFEQMQLTLSNLDPAAFKAAWQHQLERHPILRSAFLTEHQPVLQVVQTEVPLLWREQDWRGRSSETQDLQLRALLLKERSQGFNLSQAPLMRFDLIRLSEQRYVFLWHHHHILMDGWCLPIMMSEVRESYLAFKQGRTPQLPVRRPYRDYIAWLQQQETTGARHYWQQRLAGFMAPTKLPILEHKTESPLYREMSYDLDVGSHQRLQRFCQNQRITLNTLVQGAWALLLSRYSQQSDICFGVTVSGRHAPLSGIDQIIGLFINTLPLRIDANPSDCVKDYLQEVQTQHQNDNRYAHSPLFEIQTNSEVPNGTALFESLLVFENYPLGDALESYAACYQIEDFHGIEYTNYPLTLAIMPGEVLSFKISYDNNRISQDSIERLWGHLKTLLSAIVDNPAQTISHLPILTETEVQQLQTWNDTTTDYPADQTIIDLFEQQVETTPDNIAVVFEQQQLSYSELNRKANQLAHYLLNLNNGTDNNLIAIAVERSFSMVIGLLAILKTGGAYVPIDPSYPAARIRYMLDDSAAQLLLTQSHLKAQLSLDELESDCVVVCLDEVDLANQPFVNPSVSRTATDLAYVIYTSGSTGKPKGVMVEHHNLSNFLLDMQQRTGITASDKLLAVTTLSFDIAALELYLPLISGSFLYLAARKTASDGFALQQLMRDNNISFMQATPATWQLLKQSDWIAAAPLNILCGGEALSPELANYLLENGHRLWNVYGPTETTVWSSAYSIQTLLNTYPLIGQPIANTRIYILSAQHQPLPPGIPGELCIAGAGLARGYLNRPELTAEKFLQVELFGKTERIYKTGDLARWLPSGNLEYLGRLDHQIKLRGFRIELGEIETLINQHPAVKEAVVTLYQADDNKRLIAYLTTHSSSESNELVASLTETLKARLPDYMVPSHFTVLEKLPLTPNGKIDRKTLPAIDSNTLTDNTWPRDAIELQLLGVWETVLDVHPLSIHDNFFELGGHSLLAVKLMSHIQQQCGVRLPVSALFQSPSVATLAQQLREETTPLLTNIVPIQTAGEATPVYCLPGAIGSVMYLYPLASYLGIGRPFYALQTPGLDGSKIPETIESLASSHLQALRQQQHTGPYQLMGHSSGGRVAFEMAWQLEQQGETVAFLGILDTNAPDGKPNPMADDTELKWLSDTVLIFKNMTGVDINLSLEDLQTLPDLEAAYVQVMQAFIERQILFAPDAPIDELKVLVNTYRITSQAFADYQIPGKLHCPIHLFRAQEKMPNVEFEDSREAWGWTECTHAKVEEHWVPGTHGTMITVPHVETLADKLNQYLSKN